MPEHKYKEDIENAISSIIVNQEYSSAKTNQEYNDIEFESVVDMLECKRTDKDYEWMSDIFIPEFPSIIMTDASNWTNQYFQTRDFVKVKPEGTGPEKMKKAKAAELCINGTLNNRELYHYAKYVRARLINSLAGNVYVLAQWEQKTVQAQVDIKYDEREQKDIPVYEEQIVTDQFNYEVLDPRNVFTDNKYVYSVQQKDWVTVRSDTSYEKLKTNQNVFGYFNLELVEALCKGSKDNSSNNDNPETKDLQEKQPQETIKKLILLQRFGKFWCLVESRDVYGNPIEVKPGLDKEGQPLEKAELIETIISSILIGTQAIIIRFQATPYIDAKGKPYKPLARGVCYIHPTKDKGLSDGLFGKELQKGVNDTANMQFDRVKLATLPVFKGKRSSLEDNSTVYIEPQHIIELEDPEHDLVELDVKDDSQGALNQIAMLTDKMQQVTSVYNYGQIPSPASTTATAIAGAGNRESLRGNFKSLTWEHTFFSEFYWLILTMTYAFAKEDTAKKLMGESVYDFDPNGTYTYEPISSNVETEYNKAKKLSVIDQMLGRVANIPNPNTPKVLNYLLQKAFELLGSEFPDYKDALFDTSAEAQTMAAQQGSGQMMPETEGAPISNQAGLPISNLEASVRK